MPIASSPQLSRLTGEFLDPAMEQAYRAPLLAEQIRFTQRVVLVGSLFYAAFLLIDYLHLGITGDLELRAVARVGLLFAGFGIAVRIGKVNTGGALDRWTVLFITLLFLSFYVVLFSHPPLAFTHASFFVVLEAIFIALAGDSWLALTLGLAGSAAYIVSLRLAADSLWRDLIPVSLLLLFANVFGILVRRELSRMRREAFLALRAEREAKEALEESGEDLRRLFMATPVALALTRVSDGQLFKANDAAYELFGYRRDEVPEDFSAHQLYVHPEQRSELIKKVIRHGQANDQELTLRRSDGRVCDTIASAIRVRHAGEDCIMVGLVDISERKHLEESLRRLATTDPLTGLHNRHHFFNAAAKELARSRRANRPLSVIMIDLDHFKTVNDRFGHDAGDEVLRAFADMVRAALRAHDLVARFGGEEFAVALPETDLHGALRFAERLRTAAEAQAVEFAKETIHYTISIGVTEVWPQETAIDAALTRADRALYRAKEGGRNRVEATSASEPAASESVPRH